MSDTNKKSVYILIGPKGSGKTYIGTLLEQEIGIKFLRVESLLLDYIDSIGLPEYKLERDGFDIEEQAIHKILATENAVIFEATGSSVHFPSVLENLKSTYNIKLIKIYCPLDICYNRIDKRELENQFHVTDEMIREINEKASNLNLDWDLQINNFGPTSNHKIISEFSNIIN